MSSASRELTDYDFIEKPSEDFFCPITLEVLQEPFLTVCCGNHLSKEAACQLKREQKPCPLCKEQLQTVPDKFFRRKVKELKVRCPKNNAGCDWVGELGSLDQHLGGDRLEGECQYIEIACPNLCGGWVQRHDLEGHKGNLCPKRRFVCTHCAYEATYQEIMEDHWPKCSKYPLECPNKCGERDIERQHLPDHLHVCPLEVIECEFDYAGCTKKVKRQEMQSHVDSSVKAHLQLVAAHARLQEKQIEKQEKLLSTQQKKNKQQEKQVETLTAQVYLLTTALKHSSSKYHPLNNPPSVFIPPPIFTLTNFEQHKKDDDEWFSPPFYSHIGGYKMCISVNANGSDTGKSTHLSVYFYMMLGEYDDNLKWPFFGEVTVQLLNQKKNAYHYEKPLVETTDCSGGSTTCFTRVQEVKQHGSGWGYRHFISHEMLTYNAGKDCQYLMNDCLKFQVKKVAVLDQL